MSTFHLDQPSHSASHESELEYGLHHVVRHNAQQAEQQGYDEACAMAACLPPYQEPEPIGLGMNINSYGTYSESQRHDPFGQSDEPFNQSDFEHHTAATRHTPPTPRSHTIANGGRSTRSGRAARRTDSPMSSDARVSKPKLTSKSRRQKVPLPAEYRLDVPFTLMEEDWGGIPLKDVAKRAEWSMQERKTQATKKDGHISRPANAFILYRMAWADRCKYLFKVTNHQLVSRIIGESWGMETSSVTEYFKHLANLEKENHKVHLPEYKYQPAKPVDKKDSDGEDFDLDDDPDGAYMPPGRQPRPARKQAPMQAQQAIGEQYGQDAFGYPVQMSMGQWVHEQPAMPQLLPYMQAQPYSQGGQYLASQSHYQYQMPMDEMRLMNATPASVYSGHGLVGLPGSQPHELLPQSRTQTPMQLYQQPQHGGNFMDHNGLLYSDQGLQQQGGPSYEQSFHDDSHFADAIGELSSATGQETVSHATNWLDPTLEEDVQTEYSVLALQET